MRRATSERARIRMTASLALALALALPLAILPLGGCASRASGEHATATPGAPQPTKIAAWAGDMRLCAAVSAAEFALAAGQRIDQVAPTTTTDTLTGLPEVVCAYLNTADPRNLVEEGTINFEVATDAPAARDIFQRVKQSFTGVADVAGVGDAAFAGSPGGASGGTGLVAIQGSVLLYASADGDTAFVTRVAAQVARLALGRVAA